MHFDVTYDIVTPESAEHGDVAERGFICKGVDLRTAFDAVLDTRTAVVDPIDCIEANEYPIVSPRWITVTNGVEYLTDAVESRSLHFPDAMTAASRVRVARLLNCYGLQT